jgi:hypothetical protein
MAANANRKTIRLDASFIRLSPSSMDTIRLGTFNPCNTEVAAMASGGEIIPPNKKPYAMGKSGMMRFETSATVAEVKITSPNASRLIGRLFLQKSLQDVFQAAE